MKKTVAVAALALLFPLASQAVSTNLYGSIRLVVNVEDTPESDNDYSVFVNNSASRFGLRGSEEIGNGLKIGGRYELGIAADTGTVQDNDRLSYLSVEGAFGEIQVGRIWSSFWNITSAGWPAIDGSGDGLTQVTTFRVSDAVKWTRDFGPAAISAMAVLDEQITQAQGSIELKHTGFKIGFGFDHTYDDGSQENDNNENDTSLALSAAYSFDNGLGFTGVLASDDNGVDDPILAYNVNAVYANNDNTFLISYGDTDFSSDDTVMNTNAMQSLSFELSRKLGERSTTWVGMTKTEDATRAQLGLRHNW